MPQKKAMDTAVFLLTFRRKIRRKNVRKKGRDRQPALLRASLHIEGNWSEIFSVIRISLTEQPIFKAT